MKIKIKLEHGAKMPHRSTDGAAGWDLFAWWDEVLELEHMSILPGERLNIPTGVCVQIPKGFYWDIRVRSGLSTRYGIMLLNGAGVVDEDYRGVVHVPIINNSKRTYFIKHGEKIGQAILQKYEEQEFELVDELDETERGVNGFGSTGK